MHYLLGPTYLGLNESLSLVGQKQRRFNNGKKIGEKLHWKEYIVHRKVTEKTIKQSSLDYINGTL